mmetsp:Transcript_13858/g.35762  ORF Transcript_13858/g.35762 Transcript_13858/m.35762 type:complete len:309 (-) Transcript_13858:215-1141(-)
MKRARPSEVTESVTTVAPGESRSTMAAMAAMSRFLLKSVPEASTTAERSTSVSKMTPRSALLATTARWMLAMASLSSGLGTWFGNMPSGSRNCEAETSAPSGASTSRAKNPPAPLPASTTIFRPSSGAAPRLHSATMRSRSCAAYVAMKSTFDWPAPELAPAPSTGTSPLSTFSARARIALMSSLPKPPSGVKNFMPLRSYGRWLAVSMIEPEYPNPGVIVLIKQAGVVARPRSYTSAPAATAPAMASLLRSSPVTRESLPTLIATGPASPPALSSRLRAKAAAMERTIRGVSVGFSPSTTPLTSLPF